MFLPQMKLGTRTYFYKLIILVLFVSFLPFSFASMFTLSVYVKQTTAMILNQNSNELTRTGILLDKTLNQMMSSVMNEQLSSDNAALMSSMVDRVKMLKRLTTLKMSNDYFESVYFYASAENYLLNSDYGTIREWDDPMYAWIQEGVAANPHDYELSDIGTRVVDRSVKKQYIVSILIRLPYPYDSQNYLIFNVDIEKLYNNFLQQLNVNRDIYNYYMVDTAGRILFHKDAGKIGQPVPDDTMQTIKAGSRQNDDGKVVNAYSLDSLQWYLIGEVNVEQLFKHANRLKNNMLLLFAALAVITITLASVSSRQLYKPIRVVIDKLWWTVNLDKKNTSSEFDYIIHSLDQMFDKNTMLETSLLSSKRLLIRALTYNLVKGHYVSPADIDHYLQEYRGNLVVCIIRLYPKAGSESSFPAFYEQRVATAFDTTLYEESPNHYICFFKLPHADLDAFIAELGRALKSDDRIGHDEIVVSVGTLYADIRDINKSYAEAMYACNMGRIHAKMTNLYSYANLQIDEKGELESEDAFIELELAVRQQNETHYSALLSQLFRDDLSIMQYRLNLYSIVTLTIRLYGGESVAFLNEINELLVDNSMMNTTVAKNFFYERFRDFKSNYKVLKDDKQHIKKMEDYVLAHYDHPISLVDVSEHLQLTKPYTCHLVKQHRNTTFVEYLNQHRIEQAKLLLDDAQSVISAIHSKVGFNSASYFAKVFKSYTGVTPKEYKELALNRKRLGAAPASDELRPATQAEE